MNWLTLAILTLAIAASACSSSPLLTDAEEWCLEPWWVNILAIDEAARTLDLATPHDFYVEQGGRDYPDDPLDAQYYEDTAGWEAEIWPAYIESDDGKRACQAAYDSR